MKIKQSLLASICAALSLPAIAANAPDLIVHHGKIVTVDDGFSIQEAMSVRDGRIVTVGKNEDVLKTKDAHTKVVDLGGKTVLPALMDSHTHPSEAYLAEFDHAIPDFDSIEDVLNYVRARAKILKEGDWIYLNQVFITRLREQRYPTRAELDEAAPKNPVMYRTGPDCVVNTLALKMSGIDRDFKVTDGSSGFAEKDANGDLTGVLRNCRSFVKLKLTEKQPTETERLDWMAKLFHDYNSVGITSVCDRKTNPDALKVYTALRDRGDLSVRVSSSFFVESTGPVEEIEKNIRAVAKNPLFNQKDGLVRIVGIKMYMDGGMLTGSAFMREPWGVSKTYSIIDPAYRGVRFITKERLVPFMRAAISSGLQFTAHSVGDGAVEAMIEGYEEVSREMPIRQTRPCITHANFQTKDAVEKAARLGVVMDIQPVWLYMDTMTLVKQFGYDRLRWFQPLHSLFKAGVIVGGGSDHMLKVGSFRATNPYNPFLGMQTAITRKARWYDGQLHPEEALTREEAIRLYTINNAYILFCEDRLGSLDPAKTADFIVLDQDILTCPEDKIRDIQVLETYMGGKSVFVKK